jgi:hypothetical protein
MYTSSLLYLARIHVDLIDTRGLHFGTEHCGIFTDDGTGYRWFRPLKSKADFPSALASVLDDANVINNHLSVWDDVTRDECPVKFVRTDNGACADLEIVSAQVKKLLAVRGVRQLQHLPHTSTSRTALLNAASACFATSLVACTP